MLGSLPSLPRLGFHRSMCYQPASPETPGSPHHLPAVGRGEAGLGVWSHTGVRGGAGVEPPPEGGPLLLTLQPQGLLQGQRPWQGLDGATWCSVRRGGENFQPGPPFLLGEHFSPEGVPSEGGEDTVDLVGGFALRWVESYLQPLLHSGEQDTALLTGSDSVPGCQSDTRPLRRPFFPVCCHGLRSAKSR